MSTNPAPRLSYEGTLEILDELENGPKDTPARRATLERAAAWNDTIDRLFKQGSPDTPAEKR
jgi:hypothetical protein